MAQHLLAGRVQAMDAHGLRGGRTRDLRRTHTQNYPMTWEYTVRMFVRHSTV